VPPTSQHQPARPVTLSSSGQPVMPLASQPPPTRPVTLAAATVEAIMPRGMDVHCVHLLLLLV
jgi:hypothetical protein